jgi:beta-aspartyl-peptidase (threonine type)
MATASGGKAMMVHGGAWAIPDEAVAGHRRGVEAALAAGWAVLQSSGGALDAVEAAIRVLEDDPTFDAGTGAMLNREGEVELDAMLMRGEDMAAGAVAAVRRIRNPIALARRLLERGEHVFLVGAGANRFAMEEGIPEVDEGSLLVGRERARWEELRAGRGPTVREMFEGPLGTVGAVARDDGGRLAAGTSTGGTPGKYPGRVGDSPVIGAGCYCDGMAGGASATGYGEAILRATFCRDAVGLLEAGNDPGAAARDAVARLEARFGGRGGIILIDRRGRIGHAFNTPRMAVACVTDDSPPYASVEGEPR